MTGRREMTTAVVVCAAGAGLALLAAGQPWARFTVTEPSLPTLSSAPHGRAIVPLIPALALVGLAGVAAIVATRRWGRWLAGLLLIAAGAGIAVASGRALADMSGHLRALAATLAGRSEAVPESVRITTWPWMAMAGGALLVVAGALVVVRGRTWPVMGGRYETGGRSRAPREQDPLVAMWESFDNGQDPTSTADASPAGRGDPEVEGHPSDTAQ